jgi:transcription-repair coupling factor (superfamily II helicase)
MNLDLEKKISEVTERLNNSKPGQVINLQGCWGSFSALLVSHLSKKLEKNILFVHPHIDDADNSYDDLKTFGVKNTEIFPALQTEGRFLDACDEVLTERMRVLIGMQHNRSKQARVITTSVQSLVQPVPDYNVVDSSILTLAQNKQLEPAELAEWLSDNGFERVERVDMPGQFARRGGIVDVFAPLAYENYPDPKVLTEDFENYSRAVRLEFFGDTIDSIRWFDLDTQLSQKSVNSLHIVSTVSGKHSKSVENFLNVLPDDTLVILNDPHNIQEVAEVFVQRSDNKGELYSWEEIYHSAEKFPQLHISGFAHSAAGENYKLDIATVQQYQRSGKSLWTSHKEVLQELIRKAKQGGMVYLYCQTAAEIERVREIIEEISDGVPRNLEIRKGFVNQGFVIKSLDVIIITHHEIFGQLTVRRRRKPIRQAVSIDTLEDLNVGDYVVHISYGIGKFLGIKTIETERGRAEYLTIGFADGVKMQVSVNNITLVQKYIGTSPSKPKLSKIGSKKWGNQKEKVAQSVRDLAGELLELQAKRHARGGIAFGVDSQWQKEFEEFFMYQETPDQITANKDIKANMQANVPMDRLLCGDVGYGKTELAMRAVFKAVENGKQAAVLVPTTVLSVQHGRTFTQRFADFPINIEVLNRFKTPREAKKIIQSTQAGKIDILIGTHRILSDDIAFKKLGLLVIDEEQRFGVRHKEKLKKLRYNVDVLTMTATPIPRTLNMSLMGIRDISSLSTPPLDRRSVVTVVTRNSEQTIKKAVYNELNRQGQVFFLHNRVKTIDKKAAEITETLEDSSARIAVAHGQMPKRKLENTMIDFVTGDIDILLCTTIIESGLDIPNANTIIIDDADRFGLAQLHQLRGRVGRYKHRAYAYMLLPEKRPVTPVAAKRLKAIEEYSHLGAGFKIALRDLEIRGAGNILGSQQSGHIQMVGYQLYCQLLEQAVNKLKGKEVKRAPSVNISLGFDAFIPRNYIPSDKYRMEVYRKIASAAIHKDLENLRIELEDVYGQIPEDVDILIQLADLRIFAGESSIRAIVLSDNKLMFSFSAHSRVSGCDFFKNVKAKITFKDPYTAFLHLPDEYLNRHTLLSLLRKILDIKS